MKKLPNETGQALLLVLLSMAVILTIVLSIVGRSVTDITVSTKEEEALRAFSAAEAGVENALVTGIGSSNPTSIGNATFTTQVTGSLNFSRDFLSAYTLSSGESAAIWFITHDSSGNATCSTGKCFTGDKIKICWGNQGTSSNSSTTPAVEASVFYTITPGDYSTTQIGRAAFDPFTFFYSGSQRSPSNNFSSPDTGTCTIGTTSFAFQKTITFGPTGTINIPSGVYGTQNGLQFMKIRMFYNTDVAQPFGVTTTGVTLGTGNGTFPPQGLTIDSVGIAGASNRKVEVFQGFPEPPSVFDAALYSPSGIVK